MNKYKKLGQLGEGSHAKVYLAEDANGNRFALKEYSTDEDFEEMRSRYLIESSALKKVNNANIVGFIECFEAGSLSIVMELCEYGSLKSQLNNYGKFDLSKALKAGISILCGLEALHNQGLIHRDIKPDNILQGEQGVLKLADLGLAKGSGYELAECQGTVAYMSPEQYSNYNNVDARSDVYSAGATLYTLYTDEEVYDGTDIDDILDSHKNCIVPSVLKARPDCPLTFNHVIRKMIAKAPGDRYQSAQEARFDLEAIFNGAQSINELPSIRSFKEFAASQSNNDIAVLSSQKKASAKSKHLLLAAIALISILIISLVVLDKNSANAIDANQTSNEQLDDPEVQVKNTQTADQQTETTLVAESTSKPTANTNNTKAIKAPPKKVNKAERLKKKAERVVFSELVTKPLPFVLNKIIAGPLPKCEITLNEKMYIISTGKKASGLTLLAIQENSVVVDYKGAAYRIATGVKHVLYARALTFIIEGKKVTMKKGDSYKSLTLTNITPNEATFSTNKGGKITVSIIKPIELITALDKATRKKLLPQNTDRARLEKVEYTYFPFVVTDLSASSIRITDSKGIKSIHSLNQILLSRLQLQEIKQGSAIFKDIRTSKIYTLLKGIKLILRKAALIKYNGQIHQVYDNNNLFGYKVNIDNQGLVSLQNTISTYSLAKDEDLSIKPIRSSENKHFGKNCTCYEAPLITLKKPEIKSSLAKTNKTTLIDKELPAPPMPKLNYTLTKLSLFPVTTLTMTPIVPKPVDLNRASNGLANLEYLVKYCDLGVFHNSNDKQLLLSTFRYTDLGFITLGPQKLFVPGHFVYSKNSLTYKGRPFKRVKQSLILETAKESRYSISFTPNNYVTFKKFIKVCNGSKTTSTETMQYDFQHATIEIKTASKKKTTRFSYTFDDLNNHLIINKVAYEIRIGLSSITLYASSTDIINIHVNNERLIGASWLK